MKAMKDAMRKADPCAAKKLVQPSEPLRQQLLEYFGIKPPRTEFVIEDLEEYVVLHTNCSETLKSVLKGLEKDGFITGRGRKKQFTYLTMSAVIFEGQYSMSSFLKKSKPQTTKAKAEGDKLR